MKAMKHGEIDKIKYKISRYFHFRFVIKKKEERRKEK